MGAMQFSLGIVLFGAILLALLITIAVIDLRRMIIPDGLNLGLAATGIGYQVWTLGRFPVIAVVFSLAVLSLFWVLRRWFELTRGQTGLGLGDVKMAGASVLWISPWNLALYMLITCVAALMFVLLSHFRGGALELKTKVPFGPFLGLGIFVTWILEISGMPTFIPDGGN